MTTAEWSIATGWPMTVVREHSIADLQAYSTVVERQKTEQALREKHR